VEDLNWQDVEERFALLPLREQMLLLERLFRKMREDAHPDLDPVENERLLDEMVNEPGIFEPRRVRT
jgi:hypothetical protein